MVAGGGIGGDGWGVWAVLLFSHQVVSDSLWPHLLQHASLPVPHHPPEFDVMYTLLNFKWMTNKDLLCGTWDSAQCYLAAWMGGEFRGEWLHVYGYLSPFAVHLKLSQLCLLIGYTPIQNKKVGKKKEITIFRTANRYVWGGETRRMRRRF